MNSGFSRKLLKFPALMGVVFILLASAAVVWSDTAQSTEAVQGTVIAMRGVGGGQSLRGGKPLQPVCGSKSMQPLQPLRGRCQGWIPKRSCGRPGPDCMPG